MKIPLIQCVPNFSEGRRPEVVEAIVEPFRQQPNCTLLDYRADADHNRLVVTVVGSPDAVSDAVIEAARIAVSRIDLNVHVGGHPRMGAVDVIPFIPLRHMDMAECAEFARSFGQKYHQATGVPVYFYEHAALKSDRKQLEAVRKGQFEGLKQDINKPERRPDLGDRLHPTAGATAIGARRALVAFNVNLATSDLNVASSIARAVRASSGGLGHIKAVGVALPDKGQVQVSMNVVDYEKNPLYRVLEMVRMEAARWGTTVVGAQIYGMTPAAALIESALYYMQIQDFELTQVLELSLMERDREAVS